MQDGRREQKRQETHERITRAGLKLFGQHGVEATTVDAIAAEAGISRRTFFHYFPSKDDILLSLQTGLGERLVAAMAGLPAEWTPLQAVRGAVLDTAASYPPDELIAIDRLMRSSEAVQNRKQAGYLRDELAVHAGLRQRFPNHDDTALRVVALLAIGIGRIALEQWSRDGGTAPLTDYLARHFDALDTICG